MLNKFFATLMIVALSGSFLLAQKRVMFDQLELQPNGKYYQINTIPPFTGTAFDVHPPTKEKDRLLAKNDYQAYVRSAKKREEVEFKDGMQDGKATGWDEFGQKVYEAIFVKGQQEGLERQWYPNGKKKIEVTYQQGKVNGLATQWYENGQKQSEGLYTNDVEEGLHTWWFNSGSKDQEITYQGGKIEGVLKNWYENGEKRLEANFSNNIPNGSTKEWYDNGQLKAEGNFVDGKEEGIFHMYSREGLLLDEREYEAGELIVERDFRSAGIRAEYGFLQVFNTKESFFSLKIKGDNVKAINTGNIGFLIDGNLLQISNLPANSADADLENALVSAMKEEQKQIEADLKNNIEVMSQVLKGANGETYLHWHFDRTDNVTTKGGIRILEEHYLTTICGKEVLHLSSMVTSKNRPEAVKKLLTNTLNTLEISENRIDLNQVRNTIIEEAKN